jgi:hypothetical protein
MQSLFSMPMVSKLEKNSNLSMGIVLIFPKQHLEFEKRTKIVEMKGLKVLRNVKMRWISMLTPLKWVGK